jgi:uncharacterized pyridoxamine 5'-phosphate oxidase family protein
MSLSEIWPYFEAGGLANLATIDGNQARVRMMSLNVYDNKLWLVTRSEDDKIKQIKKNPRVEFTFEVRGNGRTGCLRATSEAIIVEDPETRERVTASIPWFEGYWKSSEDPNFTLIRLDLKRVLFDHHESSSKYTIEM